MITTTFVSSASVTITPTETPTSFALPAFDAGNLDLTVQNSGISPVSLGFGPLASGLTVPAGATVLLTSVAATLAASAANPLVISAGSVPGNATSCMAVMLQRGGTVIITRGTATPRPVF